MPFAYFAEAELDGGFCVTLDLEEHGWADKEILGRTVRWSLVPRDPALPLVVVNIPPGGKPVFKSRVIGTITGSVSFRCYAVGYKYRSRTFWVWVLPNGSIEVGDDPSLADLHLATLKEGA